MSYGISVTSTGGFVQIDGTYENLAVFASGTATARGVNSYSPVAFPANTPADYLIFAKPSIESGDKYVWFSEWTGGGAPSFVFGLPFDTSASVAVDWVIAVRSAAMPANNSSDYGLEVNKANGDQAFSANDGNFRCQQVAFDDFNDPPGQATDYGTIFSLSSMSGVYALMSGKTYIGRANMGYQGSIIYGLTSRWNYTNKTIRSEVKIFQFIANQGGSAAGGGFRTSLIGTFG